MINSQMTEIKIGEEFEYSFSSVNHAFLKIKLVNESMWFRLIHNSKYSMTIRSCQSSGNLLSEVFH